MRRLLAGLGCLGMAFGCTREPEAFRGAGLEVETLPPNDVARVYRAALDGAFNLGDPTLWLLVDPVLLPRTSGLAGGDTLPGAVRAALLRDGVVKGTCRGPGGKTRTVPQCRAERPGYVVRFSPPLGPRAGGDSVQVYLVVHQYGIPGGPPSERLRFERAYRVVRSGGNWRAIAEARLPQP